MKVDEKNWDFIRRNELISAQSSNKNLSQIRFESAANVADVEGSNTSINQRDYSRGVAIRKLSDSIDSNILAKRKKLTRKKLPSPIDTSRDSQYINEAKQATKDVRDILREQLGPAVEAEMTLKTQDFYIFRSGYFDLENEFLAHPRWADRGAMRAVEPYIHEFAANISRVRPWKSIIKLADIYLSSHEYSTREKTKLLKLFFSELSNLSPVVKDAVKKLLIKHRKESENCYWQLLDYTSKEIELPKQLEWLAASKLKRIYITARDFLRPKKPIFIW